MPVATDTCHTEGAGDADAGFWAACLPADLLQRCFKPLALHDLVNASGVCREWRELANSETLWRCRYVEDFSRSSGMVGSRMGSSSLGCPAARLFMQPDQTVDVNRQPAPATPPGATSWRHHYKQRAGLEKNWRQGQCSHMELSGHADYIRCAQLQGRTLATCSGSYMQHDCSIRLWDVETGECHEHMTGHEGPIWCMQLEGRRISSCDDEGGVRVWDLETHRVGVASALMPHCVKCLGMDGQQMAASGESGIVALWSLHAIQKALEDAEVLGAESQGAPGHTLPTWQAVDLEAAGVAPWLGRAPVQGVDTNCLQIDQGICAAGNAAGDVNVWGTAADTLHWQHTLQGHAGGVGTLSFQHSTGWLVAGSGSGLVRLWSLETAQLLRDLQGHTADVLCHQQSGWLLATGGADQAARVWDLRCSDGASKAHHVIPLGSIPFSLQLDNWRLAVGCSNGTVQLVDLRSAKGERLKASAVMPAQRERVWALAMSESRLVSASLDASIIVRSFLP